MKFSIVMPVYNSEHFLSESIESVLSQPFEDWELIIIDDGSSDDSAKIIKQYSEKDDRIKGLAQRNGGVSKARNYAIEFAGGEYLIFLDSDDTWERDALIKIIKTFDEYSCDIVNFNMCRTDENGNVIGKVTQPISEKPLLVRGEDEKREHIYSLLCGNRAFGLVGNFAVKREIILGTRFRTDMIMCEDLIFDIDMYKMANSVVCLPDYFYFYRQNSTGAVSNFKYQKIDNLKTAYKAKLKLADENNLSDEIKNNALLFFCGNIIQFYKNIIENKRLCREYRSIIMQDGFIMAEINKCKKLYSCPKDIDMLFGMPFIRWKKRSILLLKIKMKKFLRK